MKSITGSVTVYVKLNAWNKIQNKMKWREDKQLSKIKTQTCATHWTALRIKVKVSFSNFIFFLCNAHCNYHFKTFIVVALKPKNYNGAQSISLTPTLCNHGNDHSLPYSCLCHCSLTFSWEFFKPCDYIFSKLYKSSKDIVNKSYL